MKEYWVRVTYEGAIRANNKEELEEKLWVVHHLFGKPFEKDLFEAVDVEIDLSEFDDGGEEE